MTCTTHNAPAPCPFCQWATSGEPALVRGAEDRARRVAGHAPEPPAPIVAEAPAFAWLKDLKTCPARYRVGCGCSEPFRCVLRFGGMVKDSDCQRCIETRG